MIHDKMTRREAEGAASATYGRYAATTFVVDPSSAALDSVVYGPDGWAVVLAFDADGPRDAHIGVARYYIASPQSVWRRAYADMERRAALAQTGGAAT